MIVNRSCVTAVAFVLLSGVSAGEETPRVYKPSGAVSRIEGITQNASGIAFSTNTGTLFVVQDFPTHISEFTLDGKRKRTIRLHGFSYLEGITHVEGHTFAIVEEGRGFLWLISIDEQTLQIATRDARAIQVARRLGNSGLEGVAYDPASKSFYVVKEKSPRAIYQVTRKGKVSNPWDMESDSLGLRDLSGIHFDPASGHLFLLSHESSVVVECTTNGKEIARSPFRMTKAEGITIDTNGMLYVCGEPNDWLVFEKQTPVPSRDR